MNDLAAQVPGWIGRLLAMRRPSGAGDATILVEQVLSLDARRRICVLRCGEHRLLVLTGGPQDLSLGWLPEAPPQPRSA